MPFSTDAARSAASHARPTLTYTGKVDVEASQVQLDDAGTVGNVASFMRVYLK